MDGVAKVAKDLGISESMLYLWRKNSEQTGAPFEDQKIQSAELARLKRENVSRDTPITLHALDIFPSSSAKFKNPALCFIMGLLV